MAVEPRQRSLVQLGNGPSTLSGPAEEVLGGTEMLASGTWGIAALQQCVGEPFKQSTRRTIPKRTNSSPPRIEVR